MANPVEYESSGIQNSLPPLPRIRFQEQSGVVPRLNILAPHFNRTQAFGGIVSALELAGVLSGHYRHVRFLSQAPPEPPDSSFDLASYVRDSSSKTIETGHLYDPAGVNCHQREIFFCTYWSTATAWELYAEVLSRAGFQANPFYYFIQDFEPGFYPFSYKYMRALATYSHKRKAYAIFNSRELSHHFHMQGLEFERRAVLTPSLNPDLHAYLEQHNFRLPPKPSDRTCILLYGRPATARNCFASIMEGLRQYLEGLEPGERQQHMILSAGHPHDDVLLCPGALVKSVGKLPMDKYIACLGFSHIGISFMASPHPSYPPLEMATFGLYTITNRFGDKDISACHKNIHSLDLPAPEALARELETAATWSRATGGAAITATLPSNMSATPWRSNIEDAGISALSPSN